MPSLIVAVQSGIEFDTKSLDITFNYKSLYLEILMQIVLPYVDLITFIFSY